MRLIRLIPCVLLVGGLAAACGGSSSSDSGSTANTGGDGSGAETGITLDELPAKYAAAFCDVFTGCIGDVWSIFRPGEDCLKTFGPRVDEELAPLADAIKAGRVKYDGTKVQACLDDLTARDCDALSEREPASCQAAVEGTVKEGGDCTLDEECEGEQYCKLGDTCPGKCAAYEPAGGACVGDDNCKSGLKCDDNGHCVAPGKKGDACKQGEPDCGDGMICLGEDSKTKTPGTCYSITEAFAGKEGDACSFDGQLCEAGSSCEITKVAPLGGTCVARVKSGAECHAALPDECPDSEYCALSAANPLMPGKCTTKPAAGEKCGAALGGSEVCAPYTRCDNGVCRDIAHAGEDCTVNTTCYSDHCVGGACVLSNSCE